MKEGACLIDETRCRIPFPGAMWLPRVPRTCRTHLIFQGPGQRHRRAFGALVCALWDVGPGFLMRSVVSCPQRGALDTWLCVYGPLFFSAHGLKPSWLFSLKKIS